MKPDPMKTATTTGITRPARQGPGSGKDAWIRYADEVVEANHDAWSMIDRQSATIRDLQAEVELLRAQIETRKPKGGRPRVADDKFNSIEADLAAGLSKRAAAKRNGVSAMTAVRVARRVAARVAALE